MNDTNRALNRLLILLFGLLLLAAGIAAILVGAVPAVQDGWRKIAPDAYRNVSNQLEATPLSGTGHSWLWIALVALCVIAIILMLIFIFRQGHGRTGALVSEPVTYSSDDQHAGGTTTIDASVAEQELSASLGGHPEFVASHVSTYRVHRQPVLKISATVRRGVSPARATGIVERDLFAWDRLLGTEIPVLIQLSGGFRTRRSATTRLPEEAAVESQRPAPQTAEAEEVRR